MAIWTPSKALIEAVEAEQFVRAGAMEVLAYLAATGRIVGTRRKPTCSGSMTRSAQQVSFMWSGWVLAIALLGLEAFSGAVRQAFGRGLIESREMGYDDFRTDLARTLADPERMAGFPVMSGARRRGGGVRCRRLRMRSASFQTGRPLGCLRAGCGAAGHHCLGCSSDLCRRAPAVC